jgi:2-methylfumaryl-CoA isomerase
MLLNDVRVIEGSAFVAAPLAGMTLVQLGADVIRFDPLGGGLDARRWPLTKDGRSLYWAGLNKGKRSLAVDVRKPEGQEIVAALIAAPGNGIYLTNVAVPGKLAYESLKARRPDVIMLHIVGSPDGATALDYTVNCAVGIPYVTGPEREIGTAPVNNVLPAWDMTTAMTAALGIVAAERHRRLTGQGQYVKLPLSDVGLAMVGHLGYVAEATINGVNREPTGNFVYGAYGSDFTTKDGRHVYVVTVTNRMWAEFVKATGTGEIMASIAKSQGLDLDNDEGDRYKARHAITPAFAPWFAGRTLDEVRAAFAGTGVCWGPYQTTKQMLAEDKRATSANPMLDMVDQPGIGRYLAASSALDFQGRPPPSPAPRLGEHTDEILSGLLGMTGAEIGKLRDAKIVGGPIELS